ncbi:hypothetical protein D0469_07090 [Peribacillus saganii]|uniref:Uncharacterized protein n=1 Tax=Peribacillus saganii TaxID=2303992 RepID=A0A372LQ65_9BACI|nr:hypothetical protein [Peribacillus saganii]RFU70359.1 hypothetical protein D0469_07090 [Peribacillus saganii]
MSSMVTIVAASSVKELNKKLDEIKREHETRNPERDVEVKVINPKPETVEFKDWEATSFTVGVELIKREEDEV